MAHRTFRDLVSEYDLLAPLERASTIPANWYRDRRVAQAEASCVFGASWQCVARADQIAEPGQFVSTEISGEPILVVRGADCHLRGFFNVCRHHAAAVATAPCGSASVFKCPYHGWTYGLDGTLRGAPDFSAVQDFDPASYGLAPVLAEQWQQFVFVNLDLGAPTLDSYVGDFAFRAASLGLTELRFVERREYELKCNWKVFVDNYLDGGYHVPYVHKALNSVLDYRQYTVETAGRACLQSSPVDSASAVDESLGRTRRGAAYYFWFYPNFMLNWYEGVLDTNLVLPAGIDRTRVIFDFYFGPEFDEEAARNSIAVSEHIQDEDVAICEAVQRGLGSRAYSTGRLSVRREAGEHLFHRLLANDLRRAAELLPAQALSPE
ncbi:MAG: aromatic ring-hydroxylating dioxygenase subunit alpha [Acidobacteria bacterium]|nr:aromatic ring-hydroxylating dioxygenase subunit alpha [Acidobacteriota bacterium]